MSTTLTEIIPLIKTKLEGIQVGLDDAFAEVFDHADGDFSKFPVAVITEKGGSGEIIDTHRNIRTFEISVELYQEQSRAGKTKQEAADIMRSIFDAVIVAFDQDKDLGGAVDRIQVVSFTSDFKANAGTFNFATFNINATVVVDSHVSV